MRGSQIAAWAVAATALLVLSGWVFDIQVLKSVLPSYTTMKPITALAFLLVGLTAAQLHRPISVASRWMIQIVALVVLLLGTQTLAEYALGSSLGIDRSLFATFGFATMPLDGRMSALAAFNFILLGAAMLILASQRPRLQRAGDVVTYGVALVGMVALVGYLYGVPSLYRLNASNALAVHSAVLFVVLAIALLAAPPVRGLAAMLLGEDVGAILARRLLPVAIFVPPLVGYLQLAGERRGLYGAQFGLALFATSNVLIFVAVIYRAAVSLRGTDVERRESERALHESEQRLRLLIHNVKDYATLVLDLDGHVVSWNEGAQRLKGYTAEEIVGQHFSRFFPPEDLATHKPEKILIQAQAEGSHEDEGWRIRKDGSRFWATVLVVALKDEEGRLWGFGKITHDCTERKRLADARRESEQRLRTLTDSLTNGLVVATLDGQIFHWNKEAVTLFGLGDGENWLRKLPELVDTFELATLDGRILALEEWPLSRVIAGEKLRNVEVALRRIDVEWQGILSFSGDVVVEDSGRSVAFLSFVDVTARKRYEIELKETNERFAIASKAAGFGFWDFDIASNTLRWDDQMFALYGRSKSTGDQPYALWSDNVHPDDRKRSEEALTEAIKGARDFHTTFRIVHPDGDIHHLKASARVTRDSEGHPVKMIGVNLDITERKQAEGALRASEQRYRFLAEAVPQIIWTATRDGNPDYFNQRWYEYAGLTSEQSRDWGWQPIAHPDDVRNCIARWTHSLMTGSDYDIECRFKRAADGTYRWHLVRASPLRDRHGEIVQWVGSCTDIDNQKRADEQLREAYITLEQRVIERTMELSATQAEAERANHAKSEFLANMSHEIRTPLNAVIGLGYLLEQTTLTEDQHQYLSKIQFAGRSLLSVVNNVLDLSKIEAGEMALEDDSFELPELLQNISQMLASQSTGKGIELIVQLDPELPRLVVGDGSRLRQILINLLSNAIKFTDTGRVELKVFYTEQGSDRIRLRCEVIDTGIGIDPAAIKRMFIPFAQADGSTTRRFGGTGLGLAIARHLVELMGGEIDATSAVGVGSTFRFEIPLRILHNVDPKISAQGLRITVIDSGATERLTAMVRALGWSPQVVCNGEELLSFLNSAPPSSWPHVLIAPLQLTDMDAHELIASLEKACTHGELPPVIVVTESAQSYLLHQPRMRAADSLLVLPLSSSALFNALNAAVSQRPEGREYMLQSATDLVHAQWLVGVRVLVVDDNAMNREVAQGILQSQGAIVSTCSDGKSAAEYVRNHHRQLDAVLMDVQMPLMDGCEATRLIRGELNLRTLPIIALTAGVLVSERHRALEAGMNDMVTKPFDPQILIRKVRYFVEQIRNEPIPIAILDRKRDLRAADGPPISSIDAGVVRQIFGEDVLLFRSALSRMLRDYAEFTSPLSVSLDDRGVRSHLKARMHELRGSAGLIGATRIMRLAGAAETALEQGRSIDIVSPILGQLTSAFSEMHDEAQIWLAKQAERDAPADAGAAPLSTIGAADIDELYALLNTRNLAALDQFSRLVPSLNELLGAVRFGRLRDAMDNLDFPLSARLLREPRKGLHA